MIDSRLVLRSTALLNIIVLILAFKKDMIIRRFTLSKYLSLRSVFPKAIARSAVTKRWASKSDWEASKDGSTLVIVESPSKAKTIQKFVDPDKFIVDSCAGHIRDLPRAGAEFQDKSELRKVIVNKELKLNVADLGVDVMNNFEPVYVPLDGKIDVLKRLQKLSGHCSRILLATDEDREGEAISWHLLEVLKPKVPVKRAVFHEITKPAILESFENPRDIDMHLVESQETRRILDRLAGFTISPVLWRYVAPGLSAGRVQSCGLYLIAQVLTSSYACVLVNLTCCIMFVFETSPMTIIDVGRSDNQR
jgi:reverse gyrase